MSEGRDGRKYKGQRMQKRGSTVEINQTAINVLHGHL